MTTPTRTVPKGFVEALLPSSVFGSVVFACLTCAAVVAFPDVHRAWHDVEKDEAS